MQLIEQSWYSKFGITWVLLPFSAIFYCLVKYRFYRLRKLQCPVNSPKIIVVGNISVGGTGKTPFTVFLVDYLQKKGCKVAVISRGYGGQKQLVPLLVDKGVLPVECGDEPKLIAQRCKVPVVVFPKRNLSIDYLKQTIKPDVIIADDGLQHYQMPRTVELCIVDNNRQFGNGMVLPAGPLREPTSRLNSVDLTIFNGARDGVAYQLEVDGIYRVCDDKRITRLSEPVTLYSAIGNPKRFEQSVCKQDIRVHSHIQFPDHHNYSEADFNGVSGAVLMSEKDAVKCQPFAKGNWYYLKVSAVPSTELTQELDNILVNKGIL